MKTNTRRLILLVVAVAMTGWASARPVSQDRASQVGAAWLAAMGHRDAGDLEAVRTPYNEFYIFNAAGGGFVLVAGDDCVRPILGYSLTGTFQIAGMPVNVQGWLEDYDSGIARIKELAEQEKALPSHSGGLRQAVAGEWQRLAAGVAPEPEVLTSVSPLVTTTWNQSPLYNDMCPYDSAYGQRVVTGCVATATAQIMKYWNHPATGYGSHSYTAANSHTVYGTLSADFANTTYAWNNMPNALTSVSSQTQIDAVAQLMYHVGVAIEMVYNVGAEGGSSAYNHSSYNPSAMSALIDYFKYSPDIVVIARSSYDDATYSALLRAELDQQRPILYDGRSSSGGHSFVCDGYDTYNNFHINWGWGGYCDGYYTMGALNPAPGGTGGNATSTYNMANTALLGIRPNTAFGTGGTVSVSASGGNSSCAVSGGGSYAFGDTVTLSATASTGYRFAGWSDNSHNNPRTFTMTGGNYSFTALFETLGTDTMSYCGNLGQDSYWGEYQSDVDKYWGIKLPATSLTAGQTLTGMDFFVGSSYYGGFFDVTIYSGTTAPTDTIYSTRMFVDYPDREGWYSVYLPTAYAVEAGKSLWLTLHNTDITFPATISYSSGNPDGFLYGPSFLPDPEWNKYTFMIRGRFDNPGIIAQGDTISYCGDKSSVNTWEYNEWGIMIPAADLAGRNYLKGVKLYSEHGGIYTVRIYKGGATAPGTLVHTQPADIEMPGWHEVMLDNTVSINANDSLWITLSCPDGQWPAASCRYTGNPNSNWATWGSTWEHTYYSWGSYSWMIKAVTSATAPALPAPTVAIRGEEYVAVGATLRLTAAHSNGTTVTWYLDGGTPATATGDTVDVSWPQTGWHIVSASVSNANGTGTDVIWVTVVDCSQPITEYPYSMSFEDSDNKVCLDMLDVDNDGSGWETDRYTRFNGYRSCRSLGSYWTGSAYQPRTMDNWLVLPTMTTHQGTGINYTMQWYDMAEWMEDGTHAHYGVYIDTTAGTATSNYVLLAEYTTEDSWWNTRTLDLSAYAGKTFRLAFRHYNNGGISHLYLDDITVNENIPFFREGDTISYCGWRSRKSQLGYNSGTTRWGVSFPASRLAGCDSLKSVLLYTIENGDYTLNVWRGGNNAPATLLYSTTTTINGPSNWHEWVLSSPIAIDGSQPLWITFQTNGMFPATYAEFSGDYNSNWLSSDGITWTHSTDYNYYGSWMIKAVTTSTDGCGVMQLPYAADFTQCWHTSGGASAVDTSHASINAQGQKLTSPWFEVPAGVLYMSWHEIRDYSGSWWYNWEDSSRVYLVTLESETGTVATSDRYADASEGSPIEHFFVSAGRYRLSFEYIDDRPAHLLHLANLAVYSYPMTLTLEGPASARVGDTVTVTAHATVADGDTVDRWYWYLYHDWNWIDDNDTSSLTVIAQTDSSRTVVFHQTGNFNFSMQIYKDNLFGYHYAWLDGSHTLTVYDSVTVDCDNITLPYIADFSQCWTAENGATIIDPSHASITSQGQRLVSPWLQTQPGRTFIALSAEVAVGREWNENALFSLRVEDENGNHLSELNNMYVDNIHFTPSFYSYGGRVRIVIEYTGTEATPSFTFVGTTVYQYDIDIAMEFPPIATVGDTVTLLLHSTLQNNDEPDRLYVWLYDTPNYYTYQELYPSHYDGPATVVAQTDNSLTLVWNTPGTFELGVSIEKDNVYGYFSAYISRYGNIRITARPAHEEDSIYYTSAAKDTVIGCHPQLHVADLPASVRTILDSAFFNRPSLSVVNLPDGLTYIGKMAFARDYMLQEITIPQDVTFIGDNAFWDCTGLETVNFNADSCVTMGPTTESDGSFWPVFIGCNNMRTINIGENVTRIPDRGFWGCYGLRGTLVIPDAVTYIGYDAFYHYNTGNTDSLTIVIGRSVTSIGNYAFYCHDHLTSVTSRNPVPPAINESTFLVYDHVPLIVPCGSRDAYIANQYWSEFGTYGRGVEENCEGIDDVAPADGVRVYGVAGGCRVDGALGEQVTVYDVTGRRVASTLNDGTLISLPSSGVYMVRVGLRPACKVVVLHN